MTTYNNLLAKQPAELIEETAPGIDKLPFRFTGKELDEETGLYYYGARYLDPKYSRWLSGDPALNDYIPKAPIDDESKKHNENLPNGGVYNAINLHLFSYANNNPVKYNDPTGEIPTPYEAAIMAEHIYNGKIGDVVEGGWILNNIYLLNQDGGSGAIGVYSRLVIDEKGYPTDVEYALVNRGTSPTNPEDWRQNIDQFFGDSSDAAMSISIAIDFVQNHIYSEVTMVGHSKGGAEAILNALKTGKNAIVFNPAKPTLSGLSKSGNSLQAFVVTGDILHGMQGSLPDIIDTTYLSRQYKGKERYSHSHGYDIRHEIFPHSMEAVIQALKE
nr:RHS repeat-associated core domain-containing protein [Treponema pedis]